MTHIQDFGEKIGGARKDLWKGRGMVSSDLSDMTDLERENLVKKDNIWLRPDWEKLIKDGTPQVVAYWQNEMRKAIPPRPNKADEYTQQSYITTVCALRDAVMSVKTPEEIDKFYRGPFHAQFLTSSPSSYYLQVIPGAEGVINNKVIRVADASSRGMQRKAEKKLFGIPKTEQVYFSTKNRLAVHQYDGDRVTLSPDEREDGCTVLTIGNTYGRSYHYLRDDKSFKDISQWEKGKYFILDTNTSRPMSINFETEQDAKAYIESYAQDAQSQANARDSKSQSTGSKRKGAFVPPQLRHIRRSGPDYRRNRPARGNMYLKDLGFRAGEFGNWMTEADRESSLNLGYDAFRDLARVLNLRPEDVSLGNSLAIAFGARGKGGSGAGAAHYEPDRQVINLTKMSGVGCVAHEWGHALDHAIGISSGLIGLASEGRSLKIPQSFREVLDTMKYKTVLVPAEELNKDRLLKLENAKRGLSNWIDSAKPTQLTPEASQAWDDMKAQIIDKASTFTGREYMTSSCWGAVTKPEVELLSQIRKSATKRGIPKDTKRQFALWAVEVKNHELALQNPQPQERSVQTDFYKGSVAFDGQYSKHGHGYWQSTCEMFARAFDCYVSDKLKEAGVRSDYLTAYSDAYVLSGADGARVCAFPQGEERKLLNEKFDVLISDLKERGILHDHLEPEHTASELSGSRIAAAPSRSAKMHTSEIPAKPMHCEQLSLDALLFSADARRQDPAQKKPQSQDLSR